MEEYSTADDLPEDWDDGLGGNLYMKRGFLRFMRGLSDNANERYAALRGGDGRLCCRLALFFRPAYMITQFTSGALRLDTHFVYVPLSVARPGMACDAAGERDAFAFIRRIAGLKLVMNLPEDAGAKGFAKIRTCPDCVLDVRWKSFDEYLGALRSSYRSRCKKALRRSSVLRLYQLEDNRDFGPELYALYEQVHAKARYKIEKLQPGFFQGDFFKIFVLESPEGRPIAFFQLLENGPELIFEFAGMDYDAAPQYDTYIRVLLEIARYGIEHGFKRIEFGQTAEDAKLKLGCHYDNMYVLAHHSNPILNLLLKLCSSLLQYKPIPETTHNVFNGGQSAHKSATEHP